ncbi:uncharacterized protein LOC118456568 [Anopheles albimanus]|uniref:Uncharacterized protein n=1 Tax=Anopheles albimanus TaxID=7167 RepID=A0A182FSZ4_ANOAL|nr:uncharacterized protein LOC118456568 [Anopheles albimanus]
MARLGEKCLGTRAVLGVILVGLLLTQRFPAADAFLSYSHYVTERISNRTEFVNQVLSDEIQLKIVDYSQYVYDWDHDTLKISGKWVLKSLQDDYTYHVETTQKIDKRTAFKGILENLQANNQISDIKRLHLVQPKTFTIEKTFVFGKK